MSCGNCLSTIEKALKSIDGVHQATGSLENKTINVQYDETKAKVSDLTHAIENAGYIVI
ncbi:hypothetical protein BTR23_14745 [Alkalihalophilus pseudofirmus]|nr:hypothetical protein BTR23_14745 [Alkalihalophilus pseudofirmus]